MGAPINKTKAIEAIKGSGGIISTIAKRLDCNWATAKKLISRWPDAEVAYRDEKEQLTDMAETTLLSAIRAGDIQAAKWYLSTIGKDRGYSERHEVTGKDGESLQINVVWGKSED